MKKTIIAAAALFLSGAAAHAEMYLWQMTDRFAPYSNTAEAITGPLRLAGGDRLADQITFGNGMSVAMTPGADSMARWDITTSSDVYGQVFMLNAEPGPLLNGNTLCGADAARYLVMYATSVPDMGLGVAVFSGSTPPVSADTPELCGTFSYTLD